MKKLLFSAACIAFLLTGCGSGMPVTLGDFNFIAPSSWTIESQRADRLEVSYVEGGERFPFTVDYMASDATGVQDLLMDTVNGVEIYEVGICNGFLCYGVLSGEKAALLIFTEGDNQSSLNEYYVAESAQDFVKSVGL